jgi:Family of unknown function (DUF6062)
VKLTNRSTNFSYFELLDACKESGCPLCRLGRRSARRHLAGVIYDGVNDVPLRAALRDSYGYCHDHAWMLPTSGESAPLGIAIIHRDILNTLDQRLAAEKYNKQRGSSLRSFVTGALRASFAAPYPERARAVPASLPCPACRQREEAEQLTLASLLEALDGEDLTMRNALESSDGLCLPHLRQALDASRTQQTFAALVSLTQRQLAELIQDLDEFIRKSDHRFRDEKISVREAGSWQRALGRVSGAKSD